MYLTLPTDRLGPEPLGLFVGFKLGDVIARRRLVFAQEHMSKQLEDHRI